ncbi:MAG: hypothetical protein KGZ30_01110 [Anaplasmataceae bacterium]|nr:hypothetical protein [Anaplasmataceae bacterium]
MAPLRLVSLKRLACRACSSTTESLQQTKKEREEVNKEAMRMLLLALIVILLGYFIVWPITGWLFTSMFSLMITLSKLAICGAILWVLYEVLLVITASTGKRRRN